MESFALTFLNVCHLSRKYPKLVLWHISVTYENICLFLKKNTGGKKGYEQKLVQWFWEIVFKELLKK